jgi:hypothetical protein
MMEIDRDLVPIPLAAKRAGGPTVWLRGLEVGQSFTVTKAERNTISTAARREALRNDKAFLVRATDDGRVRVWRTK